MNNVKYIINKIRSIIYKNNILRSCRYTAKFPYEKDIEIKLPKDTIDNSFTLSWRPKKEPGKRIVCNIIIEEEINNKIIIDVGSYIGDNALVWASMVSTKGGKVLAIDPSAKNVEFITKCAELNRLNNIYVCKNLIADNIDLYRPLEDITHSAFKKIDSYVNSDYKIEAITLSALLKRTEISDMEVGLMHLDVEGMELKVLTGAQEIIKSCRPLIVWECHLRDNTLTLDILKYLQMFGYHTYFINEIIEGNRPDCRNLVALCPVKHRRSIAKLRNFKLDSFDDWFPIVTGPAIIPSELITFIN